MDDILYRMNPGDSIARNTPLKENVYMIFTCVLNKIPLFICGSPGCSKTLSLNLVMDALKGSRHSDDRYFE